MAATTVIGEQDYDRAQEIKQFDNSKHGVKGLVDSGLTSIPRFFIHPPETLQELRRPHTQQQPIPTIDLAGLHTHRQRSIIVHKISQACRTFGFFQITNHGIPSVVLDRTIAGIKAFHEQPAEVKAPVYSREMGSAVSYLSNFDLYKSKAASWRDSLRVLLSPVLAVPQVPEICRDEVVEWDREVQRLGEVLLELVSEGLGLKEGRLKDMTCLERRVMVGHYYPQCPQPDLTVGIKSHSDPGVLTVLLQDHTGGLQVKYGGGWVDVTPVPGALVINVGDLLQILSNGEYKSVDHRVLANPNREPRVAIAVFLSPSDREKSYGPLPEMVSAEKPAVYREFMITEFIEMFYNRGLDGKALVNHFEL